MPRSTPRLILAALAICAFGIIADAATTIYRAAKAAPAVEVSR